MINQILVSTFLSSTLIGLIIYIFRKWIIIRLAKSVQHEYDLKFAKFDSDLRSKENEIESIRKTLLASAMDRYHYFEKRKVKAIDDLWAG